MVFVKSSTKTLINMLATLDTAKKQNWKSYIAPIVHSYNCMRQTTTGHSPFYLMFGREPRLPIDLAFKTSPNEERHTLTKYIDNIRKKTSVVIPASTRKHPESTTATKEIL